ncbi:MAG: glycosyltransferase family 2 protein [Oscillospiraceae bacterium]|nr:glycosyltransferase family 2 protein [Oscillospiraceae bacterium]
MKLQILVPQYNETDAVVKPLLDSVAMQQNVDFGEVGVIICNDGSDVHLSDKLLQSYPFEVQYHLLPHGGVSAARQACLDRAEAEYVMFCDADDMFFNLCGLWIIFREMRGAGFDTLTSVFVEETRSPESGEPIYLNHDMDSTFVHGKVHRRQFLTENNIRWNAALTVHEDSYFNILCRSLSENAKYCPTPFYLWRWRDESVCRHDPQYILKTYGDMLRSSDALTGELLRRGKRGAAQSVCAGMVFDAYYSMNTERWLSRGSRKYREATERRFGDYYKKYRDVFESMDAAERSAVSAAVRSRKVAEGMDMERVTFDDWIRRVTAPRGAGRRVCCRK